MNYTSTIKGRKGRNTGRLEAMLHLDFFQLRWFQYKDTNKWPNWTVWEIIKILKQFVMQVDYIKEMSNSLCKNGSFQVFPPEARKRTFMYVNDPVSMEVTYISSWGRLNPTAWNPDRTSDFAEANAHVLEQLLLPKHQTMLYLIHIRTGHKKPQSTQFVCQQPTELLSLGSNS